MTGPLQILGFGAISVDEIIYVGQPLNAGQGKVERRLISHGGNVATALAAAATMGARAGFIGWLSTQAKHAASKDEMAKHGVDISTAPRSDKASPIYSTIIVGNDGDRFIAYGDDILHGTDPHLPDQTLNQAQVLMIDGYATHAIDVVKRARKLGLQVVADIEWTIGAETDVLISQSDHLVLPWEFASKATGETQASAILKALWSPDRLSIVVTKGAEGAYVLQKDDDTMWHIPAHKVTPVDTTGAGDCFHGAYAVALVDNKPPLECALFASAAAAISTTGLGGRGTLPNKQACVELMTAKGAPTPAPIT